MIFFVAIFGMTLLILCITFMKSHNQHLPLPLFVLNVAIDKCFTKREKENIIQSLIDWQNATHGLVIFHIVDLDAESLLLNDDSCSYTVNFVRALSNDPEVKKIEKINKYPILGFASGNKKCCMAFIVADKIKNKNIFKAVSSHEVGHLLYLPHNKSPKALMYKHINHSVSKPTRYDLYKLIQIWKGWI